jgi:hypothetical protein
MYIAANDNDSDLYNLIKDGPQSNQSKYDQYQPTSPQPNLNDTQRTNSTISTTLADPAKEHNRNNNLVWRLVKWLFESKETGFDVYFTDRDGQCFLHYVAKGGHDEVLEYMIMQQNCNPLIRDRMGKTPMDVAVPKVTAEKIQQYTHHYIGKAYVDDNSPCGRSNKIIHPNLLHSSEDPSASHGISPLEFFDENPKEYVSCIQETLKQEDDTCWIQLDINDVSAFS